MKRCEETTREAVAAGGKAALAGRKTTGEATAASEPAMRVAGGDESVEAAAADDGTGESASGREICKSTANLEPTWDPQEMMAGLLQSMSPEELQQKVQNGGHHP